MRNEYDFSKGVRGAHAGKPIRVIGESRSDAPKGLNRSESKFGPGLVGTAGEYYVCAELCRLGYLALVTPKNNPLFDVVVTNPDGSKSVSIQVKTRSIGNAQGWKLNKLRSASETPSDPFVVLVNLLEDGTTEFFVYRYAEFASRVNEEFESYISKPKRSGEPRKDPGFRCFDEKHFRDSDRERRNKWDLIIEALEENAAS
jgi:hypothetical protein